MPYDHKKYIKEYYKRNKIKILSRAKSYYQKNKERIKARTRMYTISHPEENKLARKKLRFNVMSEIFGLLGNECSICGEKDKKVIQIDHINGGGYAHFKKVSASVYTYYKIILKSVRSDENKYRLLCANCNIREAIRKGFRGSVWDYSR